MTTTGEVREAAGEMAKVRIYRSGACGENCASCKGCAGRKPIEVWAKNEAGARPGDRVTVESASPRVLGLAALVYLLPLVTAVLGYFVARAAGGSDDLGALAALLGLLLGLIPALLRGRRKISYTITNKKSREPLVK